MRALREPVLEARDVVSVVRSLVPELDVEGLLVIGLGHERCVTGVAINSRHRALSFVKVWELTALAAELDAGALVVATFPSGQLRPPSPHEVGAFSDLCVRAHRAGVLLLDCIVFRRDHWWSLCELGLSRTDV